MLLDWAATRMSEVTDQPDDWQVGDLALCIAVRHPNFVLPSTSLRVGRIYTVTKVGRLICEGPCTGERALALMGVKPRLKDRGWPSSLFRKIRPHHPDAEDAETIKLLNQVPALQPA